jgi:predicted RNase H-like HicB family nuclease
MIRVVRLPDSVEQDEDGVWCASVRLRPGVGAVGDGSTREAAIEDLCAALDALLEEVDWPYELASEGPQPWEGSERGAQD